MVLALLGIGAVAFVANLYRTPVQRAQEYFVSHTPAPAPDLSKLAIKSDDKPDAIAHKLLKDQKGLVIGEVHSHTLPKYFLYSSLEAMKKEGVDTIGIELSDAYQKEMDDYISKKVDTMPLALGKRFEQAMFRLDPKYYYSTVDFLEKIRELGGMRVLCLDGDSAKADLSKSNEEFDFERRYLMNSHAINNLMQAQIKGKFVILTGLGHACHFDKPPVPSLAEQLGVPSVFLKDSNEWIDDNTKKECFLEKHQTPSFKILMKTPTENGAHPDVTIESDPIVKHDSPGRV